MSEVAMARDSLLRELDRLAPLQGKYLLDRIERFIDARIELMLKASGATFGLRG